MMLLWKIFKCTFARTIYFLFVSEGSYKKKGHHPCPRFPPVSFALCETPDSLCNGILSTRSVNLNCQLRSG